MKKIIRTTTIPLSLKLFCRGLLKELSAEYDTIALSSPGKELDEISHSDNVQTIGVPMKRTISPVKDVVSLIRLIVVFWKEKPDMVHSMTPKAGLLSMVAAKMVGVPKRVHTFTGLLFPTAAGIKKRILIMTDRITCVCATHIIAEGHGVRNDLKRFHITSKDINVLGYGNVRGIDLEYYDRTPQVMQQAADIHRSLGIAEGGMVFIFVGRIVRDKGVNELVSAFCHLLQKNTNIHLLLVGDEEAGNSITETTRHAIRTNENIHHIHWQEDVRPWYAASDVLVFPSYREGFPNVVIEAGAMGLPSVVTDINGSREIIHHKENGIIVPPRDEEALYKAMNKFIEQEDWRNRLAAKARPMVATRFEQGFVHRCQVDYYHKILSWQGYLLR